MKEELWFAWYPIQTITGQWRWLKKVTRVWNNELNPWGDAWTGQSGYDGDWEYKD